MEVDYTLLTLILIVFIVFIVSLAVLTWYSGLFGELDIKTCKPPFKSLEIAYRFAKGSYKDSGTLFGEIHNLAPHLRCVGVYYDDPTQMEDRLRYFIGLVLNEEGKNADEETRRKIQLKGLQTVTFPEVEHVVLSTFPHRSFLSVFFAVNKVLPSFREYIKEKQLQAHPYMEFYDGDEILFMAPLSKHQEFVVPEVLVESDEEPTSDPRTVDETEDASVRDAEDLQPDTASSVDSLADGQSHDFPSLEIIDSLEDNNKNGMTNGSEASTESFEELHLDSLS